MIFHKSTFSCCRYLFRSYSKHVCSGVNVIWALFIVIGVSSAYFHATLSLVGQLLDELAILWGLMVAFALWTPKWMLAHGPFGEDRYKYRLYHIASSASGRNENQILLCDWLLAHSGRISRCIPQVNGVHRAIINHLKSKHG